MVVRNDTPMSGYGKYSGVVEAENGSSLSFSVPGTVVRLSVSVGDRVRKGQEIGRLDKRQLEATYEASKAMLTQAEDAWARMKQLYDKGSLTEMKWVEVESQVAQARSSEEIARKSLEDAVLTAPYDGVISKKSAEVGQNVLPGVGVVEIVTAKKLRVSISVPEGEISKVSIGQSATATIGALDKKKYSARVVEKGITANAISRSYTVKLEVDADDELMPGMVADVTMNGKDEQMSIVLTSNIIQLDEHNRTFVWVVNNEDRAEKRYVSNTTYAADGIAIGEGLRDGDRVIVEGQHKVSTGDIVSF